jgi:hypothetical protein
MSCKGVTRGGEGEGEGEGEGGGEGEGEGEGEGGGGGAGGGANSLQSGSGGGGSLAAMHRSLRHGHMSQQRRRQGTDPSTVPIRLRYTAYGTPFTVHRSRYTVYGTCATPRIGSASVPTGGWLHKVK